MQISVTIFDVGQTPLANHNVVLSKDGLDIAKATTNAQGVAVFSAEISSRENLRVRSEI